MPSVMLAAGDLSAQILPQQTIKLSFNQSTAVFPILVISFAKAVG